MKRKKKNMQIFSVAAKSFENIQCRLNTKINWRHVTNVNWRAIRRFAYGWRYLNGLRTAICVCDRSRWAFNWRRRYVIKKKPKTKKKRVRSLLILNFFKKGKLMSIDAIIYQLHLFFPKFILIERINMFCQ